jgi:serine/threonine-protein kinase
MNTEARGAERAAPADPLVGRLVGQRYRVDAVLGDGSAGRLYLAAQVPLERRVALRVLPAGRLDGDAEERFSREASIAGKLTHPNSVRLVDFGRTEEGAPFVAMEYLNGHTLQQVLEEGPLEQVRAIHVAQQICRSLREAHGLQILHRGLRPRSVMMLRQQDEQDFVKVMDFGMPRASTTGELARMPTAAANYLAPEQARNQPLDARCDVYALGAVLYEMLTGRPPFVGTCATDVIVRHLAEQPLPPRAVLSGGHIDPALERIVLRCLAKDRAARFASMDEVLDALKLVRAQLTRTRAPTDTLPPTRVADLRDVAVPSAPLHEPTPSHGTQPISAPVRPADAPRFEAMSRALAPSKVRTAIFVVVAAAAAALLMLALRDNPQASAARVTPAALGR